MSFCRSFETDKYIGIVTLGSGEIEARNKEDESIIFTGNISDLTTNISDAEIRNIIYEARLKATGKKTL